MWFVVSRQGGCRGCVVGGMVRPGTVNGSGDGRVIQVFPTMFNVQECMLMTRMHMESILVPWGTPHMSDRSLET